MAFDYSIELQCPVRQALAGDDAQQGTELILKSLKARNRARVTREQLEQAGVKPEGYTIVIKEIVGSRQTERKVSLAELDREGAALDSHAPTCAACPANIRKETCGCTGAIPYPFARDGEAILLTHVQPAGTLMGDLLLKSIDDFQLDGAPVAAMRREGLFETPSSVTKKVKHGLFGSRSVSADQLLQFIFFAGELLTGEHCGLFLVLIGRLHPRKRVLANTSELTKLMTLSLAQRLSDSNLVDEDAQSSEPVAKLLRSLYVAWAIDAPVRVSP